MDALTSVVTLGNSGFQGLSLIAPVFVLGFVAVMLFVAYTRPNQTDPTRDKH